VHAWESVPRAQGCGQQGVQGVWRQACSKSFQTSKVVAIYDVSLLGEVKRAVCGLASLLWVLGRAGMHGRLLLGFWPMTLLKLNFSLR